MTSPKWNWVRVNRKLRCPICSKPDWCEISPEHQTVLCMRVQSPKPSKGGGWFHSLGEAATVPLPKPSPPPRRPNLTAFHRLHLANTTCAALVGLARLLGVSFGSLRCLGAAWQPARKAWLFPMRDEFGDIIGLRCRAENGQK